MWMNGWAHGVLYIEVIVEVMIVGETDSDIDGRHLLSSYYMLALALYIDFISSSHQPC